MSRIEKTTTNTIRHIYRVPYPTTSTDVNEMSDLARADSERLGTPMAEGQDLEVWGDERGLNASWEQNIELGTDAMFGGAQCEVLAAALMTEAGHNWDGANEKGREHFRRKAQGVLDDMMAAANQ